MKKRAYNKKDKNFFGLTFVDIIIGTALVSIVFLGIFGLFHLITKTIWMSKAKITATAIANRQIEIARNLPYGSVGIIGGSPTFPEGLLESSTSTLHNNINYTIETKVKYVIDPADGIDASEGDDCPNDYKKVEVKVSWTGRYPGEISFTTDIVPENLAQECENVGGILFVSVFDAYGIMVPSPLIEITDLGDNPVDSATPDDGEHYFSLPTSTYKVIVSKTGFSSERTYGTDEITTPEKPHPIVLENQTTPISFSIDQTGVFSVDTSSPWGKDYYYDSFPNTDKISESNNIAVEGGQANLTKNQGIYFIDGTTDNDLCSFPGTDGDCAQSFTMGSESKQISQVQLYLRKATTSPSDIYLEIRSSSTTGPVMTSSTVVDGSSLPINFEWIDFNLQSVTNLTASTQYFLRLRSIPDSVSGIGKGPIHWGYMYSTSSPPGYPDGKSSRYIGKPYQEELDDYDFSFRIYEDEYVDSGYLISTTINAASLINWEELSWTDSEPLNTDLGYQIYYASGSEWFLIPDADLPGNGAGFDVSPTDLSGLDTGTYSQLRVKANFSTTDDRFSPALYDWQTSWINDVATPIGNVSFLLEGAKIIGKDSDEDPVYKYSATSTSDGGGEIDITNLEWDSYTFYISPASGLDLADINPSPQPISLAPNETANVTLYLEANDSLLLTVQNSTTLEPVFSAAARLYNTGLSYDTTQYTNENGQTYFIPLEPALYNLEVSAAGYASASSTVNVSGDETKTIKIEQIE